MKKIFVLLFLTFSLLSVFAFQSTHCENNCYNTYQSAESGAYNFLNFGLGQCSALSTSSSNCRQLKYDSYYYSVGVIIGNMNICLNQCPQQ